MNRIVMSNQYHLFRFSICLIIFFGLTSLLWGQSLQVIRYSEDNGLSNSLAKSVATDSRGLIWVATDGGLFLFDGHEFTHYEGEMPSPYIKSVFTRKNGDMVVVTDMGLMTSRKGERPVKLEMQLRGSVQPVDSLLWFPKRCYEDASGKLWLGDNRKIHCFTGDSVKSYFLGEKAVTNDYHRSFSFAEDGHGHLFGFAEPGFIFLYDPDQDLFREVVLPGPLSNIQATLTLDDHTILIATRAGLVEFVTGPKGNCESLKKVEDSPEAACLFQYAPGRIYAGTWASGLYEVERHSSGYRIRHVAEVKEKNINSIVEGLQGNIWLTSDNGLLLLQRNLFYSPFRETTIDYIQCIAEDQNGNILFSDGRNVFRAASGQGVIQGSGISVVKRSRVTILQAVPSDGGTWFSDTRAGVWFEKPDGNVVRKFDLSGSGQSVFFLQADTDGNLWACQDQNPSLIRISPSFGIRMYGVREGLTSRPLVTIPGKYGSLYVGCMTDTAYLFRYDPAMDGFINISQPVDFERNIDLNINDMAFDGKGILWLGSSFGLLKYEHGTITRTDLGPLTKSSVKAIAADRNGNIWMGNSMGLHLYTGSEVLSFDDRSGMSSRIINYRGLHTDRSNRIWAGTVEGIWVSMPLPVPSKTETPVIFSILLNNDQEIPYHSSGAAFHNRSFASLKVGVLDYPYVNFRLEMFLEGRDTAWQPVSRSGSIILANLEPGEYTLLLRAKKTGNFLTSESLKWSFTVTRIWYTRPWVILLMTVVVLLLFWLGLHLYTLSLKRSNERLEHAVQERTRETISQKERIEAQNASILQKNEELKEAIIGLEKAKIIAEEASEAQKKFLSVMTHELRTPLNAVIGAAHLLIRNNPRKDQFEELQILRFSAENLLGLINNILDFQKIESGKVSLEQIGFNLRNLVEEIVAAMKIRAKEKNLRLDCTVDEQLPEMVTGDPLRLSQIINNLMGNAMKFTERGSIGIELKLNGRTGSDVVIDFFIRDTGIGMSQETMNNIFEVFVQGSSETTRKYGGTGLGLVITRKLLELYGSEIRVKSEPDQGTCFTFTISFGGFDAAEGTGTVDRGAYEYTAFHGQQILLVEDNKVNKLIATKFLTEWNLKVDGAENGLIALEKVRSHHYDLILMDIQMPEMDGYQTSAGIRALGEEPYTSIPIVALTAAIRSDVSAMIFRSGMNDYISKPFNPVDLHMKIRKYLG